MNLEELKLQIKSSSEKFRRLHCLHLISYAFLRAHTRITMRISAFLPSPFTLRPIPSPYHCMKNTGNIWYDYLRSGCTKKNLPYSNRLRTIHTKKHGSRPRLSTSAKVLQYSRGSTRVFLLKYSDAPVFCSPIALFPQNEKGSFSYGKGRSSKKLGTFLRPLRPC